HGTGIDLHSGTSIRSEGSHLRTVLLVSRVGAVVVDPEVDLYFRLEEAVDGLSLDNKRRRRRFIHMIACCRCSDKIVANYIVLHEYYISGEVRRTLEREMNLYVPFHLKSGGKTEKNDHRKEHRQ
ncbi:hypothetical protein PENTCL1PPCAC_4274, partial [Pristionchus entomophagus]